MYRSAYQKGFLTVFYSVGSSPLNNWSSYVSMRSTFNSGPVE